MFGVQVGRSPRYFPVPDTVCLQLCGSSPDVMSRCAELLDEQIEVDFVDINSGCPIDLVIKKGAGVHPFTEFMASKTETQVLHC